MIVNFVKDYDDLLCYAKNQWFEISYFDYVSEEYMRLTLTPQYDYVHLLRNANVIIACFVTSYARLMLFDRLNYLQDCVLYYDTDSVIYVTKDGEKDLE